MKVRAAEISADEKKAVAERRFMLGKEGKGEKRGTYVSFCKACFTEFQYDLKAKGGPCPRCGSKDKILSHDERVAELMAKVENYKKEKVEHTIREGQIRPFFQKSGRLI